MRTRTYVFWVLLCFFSFSFAVPTITPKPQSIVIPNTLCLQTEKNHLYAGYSDGKIARWNLATGALETIIPGPSNNSPVLSLALSPNGLFLASGHQDGTLRIWNLQPPQLYGEVIRENNATWACLFTEDSRYVYTGNADGRLRKWNVENKNLENVFTRHRRLVNAAAFSPDGRYLASGSSDNTLILWNVADGEVERDVVAHSDWVTSLCYSPNGYFLITTSIDKYIKVWAVERGYQLRNIGPFDSAVWSSVYVSEEKVLFGLASGNLSLWNVETAKEIRLENQAHSAAIRALRFSKKTGQAYSASNDGMIRIWDTENLNLIATFLMVANGEWISYMPLGKYVASLNALMRNDFFVKDGDREYAFDQYRDFLQKVDHLPIGDIFGPEVNLVDRNVTPRETVLTLEINDPGIVEEVSEFGVRYPIQEKRVSLPIAFDIWERPSSTLEVEAVDSFGNVNQTTFPLTFEGFRFFLKEEHPPLPKNALVSLSAIADNQFVVLWQGEKVSVPKDKVTQTPYAPEITIQITDEMLLMNQTEAAQLNAKITITDILGVKNGRIGAWQEIRFREPVRRYELDQIIPLALGTNTITVVATNIEDISQESSLTVIRVEREPPQIVVSPVPAKIYEEQFPLGIRVSDNYLVASVSVNGREESVMKSHQDLTIAVPVAIGENRVVVEAVDAFKNAARALIQFTGVRTMYAKNDGTKVTDEQGNLIHILMKGDPVTVFSHTPPQTRVELSEGFRGIVASNDLQSEIVDLLPPGFWEVQAKLEGDSILITGFVYDDKAVSSLIVAGQQIRSLTPVNVSIPKTGAKRVYAFSAVLKTVSAGAHPDEIKPIDLAVYDTVGFFSTLIVVPKVYP
ncbi:MAG TPA: WD40 repeat domain-containing protein [Thermotogota bacterium]|nr:WD40 repeat domain-containing protein [Thermotogota bacterium]